MDTLTQLELFNYSAIDEHTAIVLRERAARIREIRDRALLEVGKELAAAQAELANHGDGTFQAWAISETGLSRGSIYNLISVYRTFKDCPTVGQLPIARGALYLLAAPSTPEAARVEAIERASNGESISHAAAKALVEDYREHGEIVRQEPPRWEFTESREIHPLPTVPFLAVGEDEDEEEAEDGPSCATCIHNDGRLRHESEAFWCTWAHLEWGFSSGMYCNGEGWQEEQTEPPVTPATAEPSPVPHVSYNSGNNEWYTPAEYAQAARTVLGCIDLDPASSERANEVIGATHFYTAQTDGLMQAWRGRVWMNPPYASELIGKFTDKLARHVDAGDIKEAICLVNNATETAWFQRLVDVASAVVFPRGRVRFWQPDGTLGAPLQGQAIIYSGPHADTFLDAFEAFGWGARL